MLVTVPGGYQLDVPTEAVDAARFERMTARAASMVRSSDPSELRQACDLLTDALALWRGEPLADAAGHPLVAADVTRLGELRLAALEMRNQAMLAIGRHTELVPELQQLVVTSPTARAFPRPADGGPVPGRASGRRVAGGSERPAPARRGGRRRPGAELVALEQQILTHAEELSPDARLLDVQSSTAERGTGHQRRDCRWGAAGWQASSRSESARLDAGAGARRCPRRGRGARRGRQDGRAERMAEPSTGWWLVGHPRSVRQRSGGVLVERRRGAGSAPARRPSRRAFGRPLDPRTRGIGRCRCAGARRLPRHHERHDPRGDRRLAGGRAQRRPPRHRDPSRSTAAPGRSACPGAAARDSL